jgi:hypothetical protein
MNKPTKFITGMLAMTLVFGMTAVGCDQDSGGGGSAPDSVVGIWEGNLPASMANGQSGVKLRMTFTATTVTQVLVSNGSVIHTDFSNAPYTYSGGTVTITVPGGRTYTGKVTGTTTTVVVDGETLTFTKVQ